MTKPHTRSALVTGGGAGIGAGITAALKADGVHCTITGRSRERPDSLDADTGYLSLDFRDGSSIDSAARFISDELRPDILINNAGFNCKAPFPDIEPDVLQDIWSVNLAGPFRITQACIAPMIERGWGRIVNISSIWGVVGNPTNTAYCATKFAVDGFTAALAAEVAHKGVLVNAVAPGYILTEGVKQRYTAEKLAEASAQIPVGRPGRPEEVGAFVAWLASHSNTYISGQNMLIDGGLTRTTHPFTRLD